MFPNIDAERARIGMTKFDLAEKLGVSYGTVKSWLSGKTDIPCSKLIDMAGIFHVSTDYLLGIDRGKS